MSKEGKKIKRKREVNEDEERRGRNQWRGRDK